MQLTLNEQPTHTLEPTFTGTAGGPSTLAVEVNVAVANSNTDGVAHPENNILGIGTALAGLSQQNVSNVPAAGATGTLGGAIARLTGSPGRSGGITGGTVAVNAAGAGQPFWVMPPFFGINFIIALQGVFSSRN